MPWKLLGTVTNMHLPDLGDVTVPALAITPRNRGLRCSRWLCAPVQRVPMRMCPGMYASWRRFLGPLGEGSLGWAKGVNRDKFESLRSRVSTLQLSPCRAARGWTASANCTSQPPPLSDRKNPACFPGRGQGAHQMCVWAPECMSHECEHALLGNHRALGW